MEFKYTRQSGVECSANVLLNSVPNIDLHFTPFEGRREMSDKNEKWVIKKRGLFMI